jgi:hypothetical protein
MAKSKAKTKTQRSRIALVVDSELRLLLESEVALRKTELVGACGQLRFTLSDLVRDILREALRQRHIAPAPAQASE